MMIDEATLRACIMVGLAPYGEAMTDADIDVGLVIESVYTTLAEMRVVQSCPIVDIVTSILRNADVGKAGTTAG